MSADVIRADGLAKRFGPVLALRDVSMHLEEGEVLGSSATTAPESRRSSRS